MGERPRRAFEHAPSSPPDPFEYHLLKSLVFFEDAEREPMPRMLRAVSWAEIRELLEAEVRRLSSGLFERP